AALSGGAEAGVSELGGRERIFRNVSLADDSSAAASSAGPGLSLAGRCEPESIGRGGGDPELRLLGHLHGVAVPGGVLTTAREGTSERAAGGVVAPASGGASESERS